MISIALGLMILALLMIARNEWVFKFRDGLIDETSQAARDWIGSGKEPMNGWMKAYAWYEDQPGYTHMMFMVWAWDRKSLVEGTPEEYLRQESP